MVQWSGYWRNRKLLVEVAGIFGLAYPSWQLLYIAQQGGHCKEKQLLFKAIPESAITLEGLLEDQPRSGRHEVLPKRSESSQLLGRWQ